MSLTIVGMLPANVHNTVVTVLIAFVASVQVASFRKVDKWSYNNTTTTGNLRTSIKTAYSAIAKHDREAARECMGFSTIIGSFLMGAVIGTEASSSMGIEAIYITSVILVIACVLMRPAETPE